MYWINCMNKDMCIYLNQPVSKYIFIYERTASSQRGPCKMEFLNDGRLCFCWVYLNIPSTFKEFLYWKDCCCCNKKTIVSKVLKTILYWNVLFIEFVSIFRILHILLWLRFQMKSLCFMQCSTLCIFTLFLGLKT